MFTNIDMQVILMIRSSDAVNCRDFECDQVELGGRDAFNSDIGGLSFDVLRVRDASHLGIMDWTPIGIIHDDWLAGCLSELIECIS